MSLFVYTLTTSDAKAKSGKVTSKDENAARSEIERRFPHSKVLSLEKVPENNVKPPKGCITK
jgi:uncharacterized protein YhbP (UPF0306 family)